MPPTESRWDSLRHGFRRRHHVVEDKLLTRGTDTWPATEERATRRQNIQLGSNAICDCDQLKYFYFARQSATDKSFLFLADRGRRWHADGWMDGWIMYSRNFSNLSSPLCRWVEEGRQTIRPIAWFGDLWITHAALPILMDLSSPWGVCFAISRWSIPSVGLSAEASHRLKDSNREQKVNLLNLIASDTSKWVY